MKSILFIGHEASRSGAPFVLLHLLRWLKRNVPECRFELLLLASGELESEFREICNVHIWRRNIPGRGGRAFAAKAAQALRKRTGIEKRFLLGLAGRFETVFGNTAVTLEMLDFFKQQGCSTFCWMHEMNYALDLFYARERFRELAGKMDALMVGSNAVREVLLQRGIERPIHVVYSFLETDALKNDFRVDVRREIGIPHDAFVVGSCATLEWRKGVDMFVQIARTLTSRSPQIHCFWLGGQYPGTKEVFDQVLYDVRKLGLQDRILFVDPCHGLPEYYGAMDVFLLPSREDPFPLVCLEAALCEKPVICFQNAGGMPEFVEDDCGFAVPYLDVEAAADRILQLFADPQLRQTMGKSAAAKVRARHDVSPGGKQLLRILDTRGADQIP